MTQWQIAEANKLSNTTKIADTDNKIQATLDDLEKWINSTDIYTTDGIKYTLDQYLLDTDTALAGIVDNNLVVEW